MTDRERDLLDRISRIENERDSFAAALFKADPDNWQIMTALRRARL